MGGWQFSASPYTYHYGYSEDHKPVYAVALTFTDEEGWQVGISPFSNSFGQPSVYAFGGRKYLAPFGWERWYWQWTAGILYGYVGQYKNKVPLNYNGFSPGFVPTIGYQITENVSGQLNFLGTSALMFSLVFNLPDFK